MRENCGLTSTDGQCIDRQVGKTVSLGKGWKLEINCSLNDHYGEVNYEDFEFIPPKRCFKHKLEVE